MNKLSNAQVKQITDVVNAGDNDFHQIVLLEVDVAGGVGAAEENNNIYRIDKDFVILWQIAPNLSPKGPTDSFIGLSLEGARLRARRFFGDEFEIDIETGQAKHSGWNK